MRVLVLQVLVFFIVSDILPTKNESPIKSKRSPLELGYVSFADVVQRHPTPIITKNVSKNKGNALAAKKSHGNVRIEWVPGHVHHHAYIPAHVHHVLIPAHALVLTQAVHVLVPEPEAHKLDIYNPYRSHYGGFGVGVDHGGHGAGHGYHVLYNF